MVDGWSEWPNSELWIILLKMISILMKSKKITGLFKNQFFLPGMKPNFYVSRAFLSKRIYFMLYAVLTGKNTNEKNLLCYTSHCILNSQNFCIKCFFQCMPLVPAVFAVVSTQQSALGPRGGLRPTLLVGNT
jgi:hypothetical protein